MCVCLLINYKIIICYNREKKGKYISYKVVLLIRYNILLMQNNKTLKFIVLLTVL